MSCVVFKLEEERQRQKDRRKSDRDNLKNKRRSLDGLVKDAEKRAQQFALTVGSFNGKLSLLINNRF